MNWDQSTNNRACAALLLTQAIPAPPRNPARLHQRYYYIDLVTAVGGPSDASLPNCGKTPPSSPVGAGLVLAICPCAEYGPAKRWPIENFVAVARHFMSTRKAKIILLGAPVDIPVPEEFPRQLPEVDNRVGKTSLAEFMAALVTCNDSGAMHVASALRVPTMAIFGSTEPHLAGAAASYVITCHAAPVSCANARSISPACKASRPLPPFSPRRIC